MFILALIALKRMRNNCAICRSFRVNVSQTWMVANSLEFLFLDQIFQLGLDSTPWDFSAYTRVNLTDRSILVYLHVS